MDDDLATVGSYQFLAEAEAARSHLEAEGIPAFLADAEVVNMDWLLGNAVGYIKLQVPRGRADAARAVLDAARQSRAERVPDDPEDNACLACGAAIPAGQSACPACGWSYAAGADEPPEDAADTPAGAAAEAAGGLAAMQALKKPVFFVLLSPLFAGVVLLAVFLLIWIISLLAS
jgi:hypothetical protein